MKRFKVLGTKDFKPRIRSAFILVPLLWGLVLTAPSAQPPRNAPVPSALPVERAQALLEAAQARHDMTHAKYERDRALARKGYLSAEALVQSESDWEQARSALKQAQTGLENLRRQTGAEQGTYTRPQKVRP